MPPRNTARFSSCTEPCTLSVPAGVDEHTVAEPKHIGAERAAEHGERGHVDCIRSGEANVVAAQRHIAVKHQRGDGEIPYRRSRGRRHLRPSAYRRR